MASFTSGLAQHPELRPVVPEGLLGRYLKEEDEATHYETPTRGRVGDAFRSVHRGTTAAQLEEYRLLERLLLEQCHVERAPGGR